MKRTEFTRIPLVLVAALWLLGGIVEAGPGAIDPTFRLQTNMEPYCTLPEPSGTFVAVGYFADTYNPSIGVVHTGPVMRFRQDGTVQPPYLGLAENGNMSGSIQSDGSIIVARRWDFSDYHSHAIRFRADGSLDSTFGSAVAGDTQNLLAHCVLPGGDMIFTGLLFDAQNNWRYLVRTDPTGAEVAGWSPAFDAETCAVAYQSDGKLVIGGTFRHVAGQAHDRLVRLNADGTVDPAFNVSVDGPVNLLAVQSDGKLLLAGEFASVDGVSRTRMARLLADGQIDASFAADIGPQERQRSALGVRAAVHTMVLQADGRILVGGEFQMVAGQPHPFLLRLNSDGSVDQAFSADVNSSVFSVFLQADGKVLIGGNFDYVSGMVQSALARLENDPAAEVLTVPSTHRVQWLRGGSSPEAQYVSFEYSSTGGADWTPLGFGTRMAGGWELTGLNLPTSGMVRARARVCGGIRNGSSGLLESSAVYSIDVLPPAIALHGAAALSIGADDHYVELGATATDDRDGSVPVAVSGIVNTLMPGTYIVRYTAEDRSGNSSSVTRTVTVSSSAHYLWRHAAFGAQADDPAVSDDRADPNGNGLPNVLEYALGGDPLGAESTGSLLVGKDAGGKLTLSFSHFASRTDVLLEVDGADAVTGPWSTLASSSGGSAFVPQQPGVAVTESGTGDQQSVEVRDGWTIGDPSHPQRFLRLRVSR